MTPSPAVSSALIGFELSQNCSSLELKVFDLSGHCIDILILRESVLAGTYVIEWFCADVNPGVYYVSLSTETNRVTESIVVIR